LSELGDSLAGGTVTHRELGRGHEIATWTLTSLLFGLLGYPFIFLVFRIQGHHTWPSWDRVLGKGDLGLVVLTVLGATIAELSMKRTRIVGAWFAGVLTVTVITSLTSVVLFVVSEVETLQQKTPDYLANAIALLICLGVVVAMHVILMATRTGR
jgi:lysylphosphatidylglycerol synthetase-like protein (DUF2156 family)